MEIAHIALVEDNPGDVHLIRKAFENARIVNELHVVGDGVAALDFVHRRASFEKAPSLSRHCARTGARSSAYPMAATTGTPMLDQPGTRS